MRNAFFLIVALTLCLVGLGGCTQAEPDPKDRFERLFDDLDQFVRFVTEQHRGLPITLVGHSMGGLVVAATMAFRRPEIHRMVLSGPLLELAPEMLGWRQILVRMLAPLGGRVGFAVGLDAEGLSRAGACFVAAPRC